MICLTLQLTKFSKVGAGIGMNEIFKSGGLLWEFSCWKCRVSCCVQVVVIHLCTLQLASLNLFVIVYIHLLIASANGMVSDIPNLNPSRLSGTLSLFL